MGNLLPNNMSNERPSKEFSEAFENFGAPVAECGCGIIHFTGEKGAYTWEEGEHERLTQLSKERPDQYVAHYDDDFIGIAVISDVPYVVGCECNSIGAFEEFVWTHRKNIVSYLRRVSRRLMEQAQEEKALMDALEDGDSTRVEKDLAEVRKQFKL